MRSKKAYVTALFSLMEETTYPQITIKQLCQKSGYSRSAFYHLFMDKDDLLDYSIAIKVEELEKQLQASEGLYADEKLDLIVRFIESNKSLLQLFFKYNKIKGFRTNFYMKFSRVLSVFLYSKQTDSSEENKVTNHFSNLFYSSSICGILFSWIQTDYGYTGSEIKKIINEIKNPINHSLLLGTIPFQKTHLYYKDLYTDSRVTRTTRTFYASLVELLLKKTMEDIKVSEIISLSGYNKSTFYKYYKSTTDLLDDVLETFVREGFKHMSNIEKSNEPIKNLFEFIYRQRNRFMRIYVNNETPGFFNILYGKLKRFLSLELKGRISIDIDFYTDYIISSLLTYIREWLEKYPELTAIEAAEIFRNLLRNDSCHSYESVNLEVNV